MATAKKKRGSSSKRAAPPTQAFALGGPLDVAIPSEPEEEPDNNVTINSETGAVTIDHEDGSITVDPTGATLWQAPDDDDDSFDQNLALKIDPIELARIAEDELQAIEGASQDRSQWVQMRAKCVELLGMKLEDPKGDVSRSALGMSTSVVRDPTMLQAVNMFRANTYSELCPSSGPVKVKVVSPEEAMTTQDNAQELQDDLNYYLTTTASEYYPDMYYMLWWTGLASGTFKKVYKCPLRKRPVSEFINGTHLIVEDSTDLKNAPRIAQEVEMDRATMRAMQLEKIYVDFDLTDPLQKEPDAVEQKTATVSGMAVQSQRIEDQKYTLYEVYTKLDIKGFEHKVGGKITGLPLPYRLTIDTTSRKVLEVRRNWDEDDEGKNFVAPKIPFVAFPFSTGLLRTYGTGLGHEMGNMASALTALLRISIDNGMMSNYPGLLKAKGPGRQLSNEIMVPPGGVAEIDTGGAPIQSFVMGMPFKDVSSAVMGLIEQTRGAAKELGGTANMPVAEGKQDAPVGTTLAMIEQALKPLSATHRMLCAAQAEEFRLLVALLKEEPEALWLNNKRPCLGKDKQVRLAKFMQALEDCNIEPVADPNVPSEMHRKLMAMSLKQLLMGNPAYDQVKIDRYIARTVYKMTATDFDEFLAPPQQNAPPDPRMLTAQAALQNAATKQAEVQLKAKTAQDQLQSKEHIEAAKIAAAHASNQQDPGSRVKESLSYKDAPPDIQRQIEQQAGLIPSQVQPATEQVDPLQQQAMALKAHQVQQSGQKMILDAHNAHADREARQTEKAMDIAARLATHPESQPVVNSEMAALSDFTTPAKDKPAPPMSGGGRVPLTTEQRLAKVLATFLRDSNPNTEYPN